MDLYQAAILDHYKQPRHHGQLVKPTNQGRAVNTLCGDQICLEFKQVNGRVAQVAWSGEGCVLTQAAASMLTEYIKGKTITELKKIDQLSIIKLIGIQPGPNRLECALLPWRALIKSLE